MDGAFSVWNLREENTLAVNAFAAAAAAAVTHWQISVKKGKWQNEGKKTNACSNRGHRFC